MSTTAAETPLLRVNGLRKQFGELIVFADMSFDLRHGRALAMVGPNGSGKSTAMRCITGADRPTEGTVELICSGICQGGKVKRRPR